MKKTLIASTLLIGSMTNPAFAETSPDLEAYIGAGHFLWDSDRNLDDATALEGGLELPIDERLSFEAWLSDFDAEPESGAADLDGTKYSLGGLYHLSEESLRPFISLGGSHLEFEPSTGSEIDESLIYLGAGAKKYFDNNIVLRGEVLAMNSLDNELTDLGIRLAIGYAFGGNSSSTSKTTPPAPVSAPVSEEKAAPMEESKPEPVQKPATPAPLVTVTDSDKDGISDDLDKCPDTDSAYKVDATGCAIELVETVTINVEVLFATNSANVSGNEAEIKKLADFLNRFKDTRATVEGHTDDRGSAKYNKQLSQRRADTIRNQLIEVYGIDAGRITALGFGEEQPIASNDTAEGRATNRRVVARVSADVVQLEKK